jgi:hypothetical protein
MMNYQDPDDLVAWARRVNGRWFVRDNFGNDTAAYLDHLERNDPDRLLRSCRNAHEMMKRRVRGVDPKPWFYAGLFSLATVDEARSSLHRRWFTRKSLPVLEAEFDPHDPAESLDADTRTKLALIRKAVAEVLAAS